MHPENIYNEPDETNNNQLLFVIALSSYQFKVNA